MRPTIFKCAIEHALSGKNLTFEQFEKTGRLNPQDMHEMKRILDGTTQNDRVLAEVLERILLALECNWSFLEDRRGPLSPTDKTP